MRGLERVRERVREIEGYNSKNNNKKKQKDRMENAIEIN